MFCDMLIKAGDVSDIDECARGTDDCSINAECEDTQGGFQCRCLHGFLGECDGCQGIHTFSTVLLNLKK